MRSLLGMALAVALVGSPSAAAGGFDPGRPGGPDNRASVQDRTLDLDAGLLGPEATFDDLATELAWLEGNVRAPHTNIFTRRCDRRYQPERELWRLDRELERLTTDFRTRVRRHTDPLLPLELPASPPEPTSWLGAPEP